MDTLKHIGLQYFAEPEKELEEEQRPNGGEGEPSGGDPESTPAQNLPKTQEELDALIEKRLQRERKKLQRQQAASAAQTAPAAQEAPEDTAKLSRELMEARAQIEAIRSGVRAEVCEDAVYLAMREAEKDGEYDADDLREALKTILKRHPEWKNDEKQKGGFRVGAEAPGEPPKGKAPPTGRVIF